MVLDFSRVIEVKYSYTHMRICGRDHMQPAKAKKFSEKNYRFLI